MGKDRNFLEMLVIFLKLKFRAENRVSSAGVDDITSPDSCGSPGRSVARKSSASHRFVRKIDLLDAGFFPNLRATFGA